MTSGGFSANTQVDGQTNFHKFKTRIGVQLTIYYIFALFSLFFLIIQQNISKPRSRCEFEDVALSGFSTFLKNVLSKIN
jgi:hypothetical protein